MSGRYSPPIPWLLKQSGGGQGSGRTDEDLAMAQEGMWVAVLVLAGMAAWVDWRSRRIPNWLTVAGAAFGFALNSFLWGWNGAKSSLGGLLLVLVLLLPFVALRGLGAGDWKLMGALGAMVGVMQVFGMLLATVLIAGLMAIVQITLRKRWRASLGNLGQLAKGIFVFRLRPHPVISLDNPTLLTLPFGVAAGIAVGVCYVLRFVNL